jgi:HrpA-like RNA helicase
MRRSSGIIGRACLGTTRKLFFRQTTPQPLWKGSDATSGNRRRWKTTVASVARRNDNNIHPHKESEAAVAEIEVVDSLQQYGPLGRPALTETLLNELFKVASHSPSDCGTDNSLAKLEDLIRPLGDSGGQFQSRSPKLLWNEAGNKFGFEPPQYRHEKHYSNSTTTGKISIQRKVTALTVLPNPATTTTTTSASAAASYCYDKLAVHDNVGSHPDYDWIELVAVGIAATKQRAEQLAALDQMRLWKEATGIDLTLPPDDQSWPSLEAVVSNEGSSSTNKSRSESSKSNNNNNHHQYGGDDSALETLYSKSQTLLELLRCSRIRYDFDYHQRVSGTKIAESYWTAEAETYCRGNYYFSTGTTKDDKPNFKASSKKEAEKHALIALLEQNKDTPLGTIADTYRTLLDSAPQHQIAALRIPRWKKGLAKGLESSLVDYWGRSDGDSNNSSSSIISSGNGSIINSNSSSGERRNQNMDTRASAATSAALWEREQAKLERCSRDDPQTFESIQTARGDLPIAKLRKQFREALQNSNVVLVEAGTGSGKSTQIPQYILEDALSSQNASNTRILVTQPRRIAAKSLSERVAYERFEPKDGSDGSSNNRNHSKSKSDRSVGYSVRFESLKPRREGGTIEYVTTGILLRRLLHGDKGLEGISHILIDEVHERDLNTDLLLVLMRDLLVRKREQQEKYLHTPKLVLLSATLETNALTDYFAPASMGEEVPIPVLSLPTKPLHPVKTCYLEDFLGSSNNNSESGRDFSSKLRGLATSLLKHNEHALMEELEILESGLKGNPYLAKRIDVLERAVSLRHSRKEENEDIIVPLKPNQLRSTVLGLVAELALHLSKIETTKGNPKNGGSILCFLPGMDEIMECMNRIEEDCPESLRNKLTILPLHSEIPHNEQARVFHPCKPGTIKVILSTNIAESSLTIEDVLAVIDSGLVKEPTFDAVSSMTTVETSMASRASSTQRLGRVGRVAPGTCYRLYSRGNFEAMDDKATPEIQKTCLEGTCLQVCSLLEGNNQGFGSVKHFLANTMDPPPEDSVEVALEKLHRIGAIVPSRSSNEPENLTRLGECLVRLPLDPSIGKMLVVGAVMNCLGPLLTAAAWFGGSQNVFSHPIPGQREEAKESHRSFSETSDIEGIVRAYDQFWELQTKHGWKAAKTWAREHFVNPSAMVSMGAIRRQLLNELRGVGLVDPKDVVRGELHRRAKVDRHGDCQLLVGALWCTAVPKNLAARNRMGRFGNVTTAFEEKARLHPSSVLFHRKPPSSYPTSDGSSDGDDVVVLPDWYLYCHKVQTSDVFLRGCSSVLPEQILLFGGSHLDTAAAITKISNPNNHNIRGILDGWITIESSVEGGDETVDLLIRARETIESILERKLLNLSSKSSQRSPSEQQRDNNDDLVFDGIRGFFDNLETSRIPEPEPRAPSNDFHDYFLEEDEAEG